MFYYKLIISIIILYQSCEIESNKRVPLVFQNNTEYSVITFFNDNYEDYKALYPDTNISALIVSDSNSIIKVSGHSRKGLIHSHGTWENIFDVTVPRDTLSLFVFHADTVAKYDWETIRAKYNILKRYDLSLEDLKRLDFLITYPPSNRMKGVKMWPIE